MSTRKNPTDYINLALGFYQGRSMVCHAKDNVFRYAKAPIIFDDGGAKAVAFFPDISKSVRVSNTAVVSWLIKIIPMGLQFPCKQTMFPEEEVVMQKHYDGMSAQERLNIFGDIPNSIVDLPKTTMAGTLTLDELFDPQSSGIVGSLDLDGFRKRLKANGKLAVLAATAAGKDNSFEIPRLYSKEHRELGSWVQAAIVETLLSDATPYARVQPVIVIDEAGKVQISKIVLDAYIACVGGMAIVAKKQGLKITL